MREPITDCFNDVCLNPFGYGATSGLNDPPVVLVNAAAPGRLYPSDLARLAERMGRLG